MTRNEREELLRRFLDGELDSSQEHDFYINVALDSELRTELKAHQTIDSAIGKDRTLDPMELAPMEMAVASMLTSIPRNTASPSAPAAMPAAPRPASAADQSDTRSSTRWFVGGAVLMFGIVAALLVTLWPSEPAPAGAFRSPQQASQPAVNPATQPDTLKNAAAAGQRIIAEPNVDNDGRQIVQEQQEHPAVEQSTRSTKGSARPESGAHGESAEQQVQQNSGHQQQTEQAARSQSAPQHYRFNDSTKWEVRLQFKNPLPR